jgi:REP element-mobilizing transposase RayT
LPDALTRLLFHVVFATKGRSLLIDAGLMPELLAYIAGIVRNLGGTTIAANGQADHVHLLLVIPPTLAVADVVRVVKCNSSRWVHATWPDRRAFAWQAGYSAFSVSAPDREAVARYIESQAEHHSRGDFMAELAALLARHGIEMPPGSP